MNNKMRRREFFGTMAAAATCTSCATSTISCRPRSATQRVALVRRPVVYAQQVVHKAMPLIPPDDEVLNQWLVPTDDPTVFKYANQEEASQRDNFMPYYRYPEGTSYRMYFDPGLRSKLW